MIINYRSQEKPKTNPRISGFGMIWAYIFYIYFCTFVWVITPFDDHCTPGFLRTLRVWSRQRWAGGIGAGAAMEGVAYQHGPTCVCVSENWVYHLKI